MFLANSLKEKWKRNYLENENDSSCNVKYSYARTPQDPRRWLSFKNETWTPSNELWSTQKLQAMDKKEWEGKFSLKKLRKEWKTKVELDFDKKHKKFSDDMILPKVVKSKQYVKAWIDPDVWELKQKRWNISSESQTKTRPELKQTVFEVSHGLKDFKVVPLTDKWVEEGCDSRNFRDIDGDTWNISTKMEKSERKELLNTAWELNKENSSHYWKSNETYRINKEAFPISEDRKKVEIIRYFKNYRTPYQNSLDLYNTMRQVRDLTALQRAEVEKKVLYNNPGTNNKDKINALVFKEMFNTYRYKYNEITGRLDKDEIKRRQFEENKFRWKDHDLVNKMLAVSNIDNTKWFRPEYVDVCQSQENMKRELLQTWVTKANEIHIEEDKIKEKQEEEYKKQQKRELLLKAKQFSKRKKEKEGKSKYPITKEVYETLCSGGYDSEGKETRKNILLKSSTIDPDNKRSAASLQQLNQSVNTCIGNEISTSMGNGRISPFFWEAYKKVTEDEIARWNKIYRKNKDNISYLYSHPGAFREFEFEEEVKARDAPELPEYWVKKKIKKQMWSCCMNGDEDSKGCQKKVNKKFKWIWDGP